MNESSELVPLSEITPGQWLFFNMDGHAEYGIREKWNNANYPGLIAVGHDHIWTSYLPPDTLVFPCSSDSPFGYIPRQQAEVALGICKDSKE